VRKTLRKLQESMEKQGGQWSASAYLVVEEQLLMLGKNPNAWPHIWGMKPARPQIIIFFQSDSKSILEGNSHAMQSKASHANHSDAPQCEAERCKAKPKQSKAKPGKA